MSRHWLDEEAGSPRKSSDGSPDRQFVGLVGSAVGLEMPADGVCFTGAQRWPGPRQGAALSLRPPGFHGMVGAGPRSVARSGALTGTRHGLRRATFMSSPIRWRLQRAADERPSPVGQALRPQRRDSSTALRGVQRLSCPALRRATLPETRRACPRPAPGESSGSKHRWTRRRLRRDPLEGLVADGRGHAGRWQIGFPWCFGLAARRCLPHGAPERVERSFRLSHRHIRRVTQLIALLHQASRRLARRLCPASYFHW